MIIVSSSITIDSKEIEISFSRSSGPGGQNVNKVNSKVTLRWALSRSTSLPEEIRLRLLDTMSHRLTSEGFFVVQSDKYRDQSRNIEDCKEKVRQLVLKVLFPPKPRKPTKPSKAQKAKRLQSKKERSEKKQNRKVNF